MNAIVYTTQTCAYCPMVKKFLDRKGIKYESIDVTDDSATRQELQKKYGAVTVPVTVIGDKVVIGYNPGKLAEAVA